MKNKVDYTPADKVDNIRVSLLIIAVICIIAAIIIFILGEAIVGVSLIGISIILFLCAHLVNGFCKIVEAACEYSWEFNQKHSQKAEPKMDDADVQ